MRPFQRTRFGRLAIFVGVVGLVAEVRSNREIAESLVITEGTVEVHVKHILSKLGFRSRTQVAGWVARQDPG